jgi:hypothetical protein
MQLLHRPFFFARAPNKERMLRPLRPLRPLRSSTVLLPPPFLRRSYAAMQVTHRPNSITSWPSVRKPVGASF